MVYGPEEERDTQERIYRGQRCHVPSAPTGSFSRSYSVMRSTMDGTPLLLFDYDVTIGIANNRNVLRRTVAAFDVTATPLPQFALEGGRQDMRTRCESFPANSAARS